MNELITELDALEKKQRAEKSKFTGKLESSLLASLNEAGDLYGALLGCLTADDRRALYKKDEFKKALTKLKLKRLPDSQLLAAMKGEDTDKPKRVMSQATKDKISAGQKARREKEKAAKAAAAA